MKQKILFSLTLSLLLLSAEPGLARAEDTTRKAARTELKAEREELKAQRCEMIESRIENRLNSYDENSEKYSSRYNGVVKKLTDLTSKLEAKGCNVTQVKADLVTFQTYIDEMAAAFRVFIDSFKGTKAYACGESKGEFSSSFATSRQNLLAVKQKAQATRSFFLNTLRPHVKSMGEACKQQLKSSPTPSTQPEGE